MIAGEQLCQVLDHLVSGRVYAMIASGGVEKTPPYIVFQTISTTPEDSLDGFTGHEWAHMQIDVYHNTLFEATLLANRVVSSINNQIKPSVYDGSQQLRDDDTGLYRILIDYEFWQTTPTE